MTVVGAVETWTAIGAVAITAVAGDILTAGAMRRIGDLDLIREKSGLGGAIKAVVGSPMFLLGVCSMAVSFFSLLFTLSVVDVSLQAQRSRISATPSRRSSSCMRTSTNAAGSLLPSSPQESLSSQSSSLSTRQKSGCPIHRAVASRDGWDVNRRAYRTSSGIKPVAGSSCERYRAASPMRAAAASLPLLTAPSIVEGHSVAVQSPARNSPGHCIFCVGRC